ncbi:glycosyl hydrolase [Paenibacillus thalictri]|nr:glycosyl hydrolase [Paenibacillus thalictri]
MDWKQNKQPSSEYRIHPFWFWNGEMADDQLERQIAEMADKGVGGFFLCARQGMTIPYLSQAWFAKVRTAVESAEKHGLHVWLYDEYPYPSGIAGGEVTLTLPEAKHYTLVQRSERVAGGSQLTLELPWARILYAKAVPVSKEGARLWEQAVDVRHTIGNFQADPVFQKAGLTAYNQKRFFTYRTIYKMIWDAPPGDWEVVVFQEKEIEDFKYYGTFVDPCHREAMAEFIRLTHDKYAEHLGDHFGKTIKGMFTDEIGLLGHIPWSPQLPAYFRERCGYELQEQLPALYCSDHPNRAKIRYDFFQTVHLLLRESYHKQVHDWCERHGLQYVAEVPAVRMTTQLFSHVPGGDSAHEKLGRPLEWILNKYAGSLRANPKMVSSLARQLGRKRNLIECFHSVGWSMTLQDAKWMIDRMAALGTNMYNFHAFFYTLNGMVKHDAPPSQFLQNPYWPHFRKLGDYTGRISSLMSAGQADIRIAVLDPTTTLWAHMGNPFHGFQYGGSEAGEKARLERLQNDWETIGIRLLQNRRDYDHLDPELLQTAELSAGAMHIGDARYEVLIVPPLTNMEAGAWVKLRQFAEQGGTVIAIGLLPSDRIEEGSPDGQDSADFFGTDSRQSGEWYWGQELAEQADNRQESAASGKPEPQPWEKGQGNVYFIRQHGREGQDAAMHALVELLERVSPAAVKLESGGAEQSFLMQTRRFSDRAGAVFVSHQEDGTLETTLCIDSQRLGFSFPVGHSGFEFSLYDLETGDSQPVAASKGDNGIWRIPLSFAPYQSHLIEWSVPAMSLLEEQPAPEPNPVAANAVLWTLQRQGEWQVKPLAGNAIRFESFGLTIGAGTDMGNLQKLPVKAKTFIDQCDDLSAQLQLPVAFRQTFGTPFRLSVGYPVACTYQTEFTIETMPKSCRLLMDEAAISGEWMLYVNGHPLTREHFSYQELYDHKNIACDVVGYLRPGLNELTVALQVEHDWDGVVDPLYVTGPFGVRFDEQGHPVMTAQPERVSGLPEVFCPGYPYYAGTIGYTRTLDKRELPEGAEFELQLEGWTVHDTVEVLLNGRSLGVRPWSPYRWFGSSQWLTEESNELEVRVTYSLAGLLEGRYFDDASHSLLPVQQFGGNGR